MSSLFCLPSFGSKMLPLIQPNVSENGFGEEGAFERFAWDYASIRVMSEWRHNRFCFPKGMASFQGGRGMGCRRTVLGEEGGVVFVPTKGYYSFTHVHSRGLKDLAHRSEAIARPVLFTWKGHLVKLMSVLPFQAVGGGVRKALLLWLSSLLSATLGHQHSHSLFLFPFPRQTLMGGTKGEGVWSEWLRLATNAWGECWAGRSDTRPFQELQSLSLLPPLFSLLF